MTGDVQRDMGAILAAHLDHIQPDLAARQHPYRWAAEMTRRVDIATAYVHDLDCVCGGLVECPKHYLLRVLEGDQ